MTEERLKSLEGWAGYPDRDPEAARLVRDLVREVRRLQAAAVPPFRGILAPFDGKRCADVYGVEV